MLLHRMRDVAIRQVSSLTRARDGSPGKAILVIQPDHLGDILLSQPAVRAIRDQHPDRRIIGVVGPWSEHIARRAWDVDDILTIPFPAFSRMPGRRRPYAPYLALVQASASLKRKEPAAAYVLRPDDWWSAWLASTATSGSIVTARDPRMNPFATVQVDVSALPHAAEKAYAIASGHVSRLVASEVRLDFPPNDLAARRARDLLEDLGVVEPYTVIHHGAGAGVKTWSFQNWRYVAGQLASPGHRVILTGSESEAPLASRIAADGSDVVSLAGQTGLDELAEILRRASVVIGPDSGPLHLAVACGTPTVHLFGPSDPARYGPWGCPDRHRVVTAGWSCARCGDLSQTRPAGCGCMLALRPDDVITAVNSVRRAANAAR